MIFVAVGSGGYPFGRLIKKIDELAQKYSYDVVIQKGSTKYKVKHCRCFDFMNYSDYINFFKLADLIISHTSTGPLLYSKEYEKPIITIPRRADRGEHIDDHQLEVARALANENEPMRMIVFDEFEIEPAIPRMLSMTGKKYCRDTGLISLRQALRKEVENC